MYDQQEGYFVTTHPKMHIADRRERVG
jgi:hypothetical protein